MGRYLRAALDDRTLWLAGSPDPADVVRVELDRWDGSLPGWPSLEEALQDRGAVVGQRSPNLRIALLPPLCSVRSVPNHGLRNRDLELIYRRNPARYFIDWVDDDDVVAVDGLTAGEATIIRARDILLQAIEAAASGWNLTLVPAEWLWAGTARIAGAVAAEVVLRDKIVLVRSTSSGLSVRRSPVRIEQITWGPCIGIDVDGSNGDSDGPTLLLGDGTDSKGCPGAAAAAATPVGRLPALASIDRRRTEVGTWRRRAMALVAFGVGFAMLGETAFWLRTRHALQQVTAERAELRDLAHATQVLRDRAVSDVAAIRPDSDQPPSMQWAGLLADLAGVLPQRDFVTGAVGTRDSVSLEIMTADSAASHEALASVLEDAAPTGEALAAADTSALRGLVFSASRASRRRGQQR